MPKTPKKIAVIFNAASGPQERKEVVENGIEKLRDQGFHVFAETLPKRSAKIDGFLDNVTSGKYDILIAAGGDGSVNGLAQRLVGTEIQLFVVPAGTFNHFAKHIGMPNDIDEAFSVFGNSELKYIDTGEVNGKAFVNFSSVGMYTLVIRERIKREKVGAKKWPAFFFSLVRNMARYRVLNVTIERSGKEIDAKTPMIFVGNNPFVFGGTDVLDHRESFEEGVLHFLIAKDCGRFGLVRLFFVLLLRNLHHTEDFNSFYLKNFEIRSKRKRLHVSLDGEIETMETPLLYKNRPRSLAVLVPRKRG